MPIATTAQAILWGDISIYLAANDNANGAIFGRRITSPSSPITIAMVTDALRWGSATGAQTAISVREVTNYLIWLEGKYGQEAQYIAEGGGGGSVIPVNPGAIPSRLDFIVSDSTPVSTGQSSVIFTDFVGYSLLFNRGNQPQMTIDDGFNTWFSWNKLTGQFQCFGAANESEPFSLIPYL